MTSRRLKLAINTMKKVIIIIWIGLLAGVLCSEELHLFFTNDTHGAYLPRYQRTDKGNILSGGYVNLHNHLTSRRQQLENTLWLDAGDQQTGSIFSSLNYDGISGGAVVEAFNLMSLDAATLGNHEFDQSFDNTLKLINAAKYSYLSANLVDKRTNKPLTGKPYEIFRRGNLKIGVLGLTLTELPEKVKAENVRDISILPYGEAIDKYIAELDEQTDLIILLTHNGFRADSLLATQLDDRVDVIVGGHSHHALLRPMEVNNILILQAGAYLTYYGWITLQIENDRISGWDRDKDVLHYVIPMEGSSELSEFVGKISHEIESNLGQVIAVLPHDWVPDKFKESEVSRWQAQALFREYEKQYQPDLAMLNCGGIRKAISKGEVTLRDMREMLPFNNYITLFSCYGRDLKPFILHNLKLQQSKEHDIVQTCNLTWKVCEKNGLRDICNLRIGGRKVKDDKVYRVISHDYLAGQADKYLLFTPFNQEKTGDLILDVMIRQVQSEYGKKKF